VYNQVMRINSDLMQHAAHERGFVFAIAIAKAEDVGCRMRLETANPDFNRDIANVGLQEGGDGDDFVAERGFAGGQLYGPLVDLGRCLAAAVGKIVVPSADFLPGMGILYG